MMASLAQGAMALGFIGIFIGAAHLAGGMMCDVISWGIPRRGHYGEPTEGEKIIKKGWKIIFLSIIVPIVLVILFAILANLTGEIPATP